jgi:AraC-like DNA-binding protein
MINSAVVHGISWSAIARATELSPEQLRSDRFSGSSFLRISREVKLLMSDEFCGFTRTPCRIGTFTQACERAAAAATVGEGLEGAFQLYAERHPQVSFELHQGREMGRITLTAEQSDPRERAFLHEWWFMLWRTVMGWLAREDIPAVVVELTHLAGSDADEYAEAIGGVVRFGQPRARLLFPVCWLHKPVRRTSRDLDRFLAPARVPMAVLGERRFRNELKRWLRQQLSAMQSLPSIEAAAAHHHMTSQTLRRRLRTDATTYRALKEEVRCESALDWLGQERVSIAEASYRAGFAEPNGLSRALKAWTGISPSGYRDGALA